MNQNKLTLNWDKLDIQVKENILCNACINSNFVHYKWNELDKWIQDIITSNMEMRSKNTVSIIGE